MIQLISSSSEKKLLKPLKITIFETNLRKKGVSMDHIQNKKPFFLEEITKADHQFSKTFFIKILYVLAELWIFFVKKKGSFSAKTTVREPRHTKNDQILSLRIFLGSFFYKKIYLHLCLWFILSWESPKSTVTELVQRL